MDTLLDTCIQLDSCVVSESDPKHPNFPQVMLEGFLLSDLQARREPWSYIGRVVPIAWATAIVALVGVGHAKVCT